jgi:hypothetical protein
MALCSTKFDVQSLHLKLKIVERLSRQLGSTVEPFAKDETKFNAMQG